MKLRFLGYKAVERNIVKEVSHETVRKTLKNELRPHLVKQWVIPSKHSAAFVWRTEEVLDLYEEPYGPKCPVVCFDERPCQLVSELREPLLIESGKVERLEFEFEQQGI